MTGPEIGSVAPDFTLPDQDGQGFTLSDLRGESAALLVFYPFAFSGICSGELCALRDDIGAFRTAGVQVVGVSCDPRPALRAWADQEGYDFPLLSDFWPHGEVSRALGAFDPGLGVSQRLSLLVVNGAVVWSLRAEMDATRSLNAHLSALDALA